MNAPHRPAGSPASLTAYRPFIDGLRAVSILSVVAYHAGIPGVTGGYVGVDIFFVISGFLIISQIAEGLRRGTFSFGEFWSRRALRILPPYFLVMGFAIAAAPFVLAMPDEFQEFGKEVGHAAVMAINHLFLIQQGYFDAASDTKVLLHFWSLAVEEQFYLVAPLLLAAIWWLQGRMDRSGLLEWVTAIVFVTSLAGCVLLTGAEGDRNYAFYLSALRAWEFVAGGVIGFFLTAAIRWGSRINAWLAAIGLAAILASVFAYSVDTPYPSWRAIVPAFGAAALILAGLANPQAPAVRLLATPPMVWIGLVSYSWYLWHWPVLALARIRDFGERDFPRDLALCLMSLALAAATFYLLERPIRLWRQKRCKSLGWRPVFAGVACCAAVAVGGLLSFDAAHKRLEAAIGPEYLPRKSLEAEYCDLRRASPQDCSRLASGRPVGLLIGDSQAVSARNRIATLVEANGGLLASAASPGCMTIDGATVFMPDAAMAADCASLGKTVMPALARGDIKPGYAILYARWQIYATGKSAYQLGAIDDAGPAPDQAQAFIAGLRKTIADLRSFGMSRILIVGPTPFFPRSVPNCLYLADRHSMDRARTCGVDRAAADNEVAAARSRIGSAITGLANVRYLDPFTAFCDAARCLPYAGSDILIADTNHLSDAGMDRILARNRATFEWLITRPDNQRAPAVAQGAPLSARTIGGSSR